MIDRGMDNMSQQVTRPGQLRERACAAMVPQVSPPMKTKTRPLSFQRAPAHGAVTAAAALLLPILNVNGADVLKDNNTNALNTPTSWVGGVVPGDLDIALWDSTVLGANSSAIGGSLSWCGIRVTNPGGAV